MTSIADRTITALRSTHDDLAAVVPDLTDDQLAATSGASEWTVAQVLSHLGSGAELTLAGLRTALDGGAIPDEDFSQTVWDRWNALTPREQAQGVLEHDAVLVETLEALTSDQRENVSVELSFAPVPLPLASFAGIRLSEAAYHSWDARVALDPAATVDATIADVLVYHFTGGLAFLLGFTGKADQLSEPAVVAVRHADLAVVIGEQVSLSRTPTTPTATFTGEVEAALRLIAGRLTPAYTPVGVEVTGNVTMGDLRRVFPGY